MPFLEHVLELARPFDVYLVVLALEFEPVELAEMDLELLMQLMPLVLETSVVEVVTLEVDHHPLVEACRTITDLTRRIRRTTGSAVPCEVGRMCGSRTGFVEL